MKKLKVGNIVRVHPGKSRCFSIAEIVDIRRTSLWSGFKKEYLVREYPYGEDWFEAQELIPLNPETLEPYLR